MNESATAGLKRYLEASAGLAAILERNLARATEPALKKRLADAIDMVKRDREREEKNK
jgi:hypothetical protein